MDKANLTQYKYIFMCYVFWYMGACYVFHLYNPCMLILKQ